MSGKCSDSSRCAADGKVPIGVYVFTILAFIPPAAAKIAWNNLISKSRELSMSGVLGLVETDILFAQPGTTQKEYWRLLQSLLGMGSLRILSKICSAPCFEFLHHMYGIKPPESVFAREFWLNQESWTEISGLGMTQEDTSYHRINQGSGPQAKVLWTREDILQEEAWWQNKEPTSTQTQTAATTRRDGRASSLNEDVQEGMEKTPAVGVLGATVLNGLTIGGANKISRVSSDVSEGTTDKWWMDRWQCETLAVAAIRGLSVAEACNLCTTVYFGEDAGRKRHLISGVACCILSASTFGAAAWTNWSWIPQLLALTALGYFVNRTATLRSWRFEPNPILKDYHPRLMHSWPEKDDKISIVRFAVQSSGFCHLKGRFAFDADQLKEAVEATSNTRGRYKSIRKMIKWEAPYQNARTRHWLSYETQSTYYGLVASVIPDNIHRRSWGVLCALINGLVLLVLGFGATVAKGWSGIVLGIYVIAMVLAIAARRKGAVWTLPEFAVVDLTNMDLPSNVRERIEKSEKWNKLKEDIADAV